MKRLAALMSTAALMAGVLVGITPATTAGAAQVKACVNKKTGDIRFLTGTKKRKCAKGWKKVTWNQRGPRGVAGVPGQRGNTGPVGPKLVTKDATGAVIGPLMSYFPGGFSAYAILINGGVYVYDIGGRVLPTGTPVFTTADCTGTAYRDTSSAATRDIYLSAAGSNGREVYRPSFPTPGQPIRSYTYTRTALTVGAPTAIYEWNTSGTCQLEDGGFTGYLVELQPEATPPRDVSGPIVLAEQ